MRGTGGDASAYGFLEDDVGGGPEEGSAHGWFFWMGLGVLN